MTKSDPVKEWHPALLDDRGLKFETVRIADINVDPAYQRPLRETKINMMWRTFDPAELTAIVVSRRDDGGLWVLDGQHRIELLTRLGKTVVLADVREGLTREQEAHLFYRLNEGQTKVGSWDKFRARMAAKEPVAMRIAEIIGKHGFHVGRSDEDHAIQAVSALEDIYSIGRLDKTLAIISTVWPNDKTAREAVILQGMGAFLQTFDGQMGWDDGRILEVLDKIGPSAIQRRAREIQLETGRSYQRGATIAIAFRDAYNGLMTRGSKPKVQLYGMPLINWSGVRARTQHRG